MDDADFLFGYAATSSVGVLARLKKSICSQIQLDNVSPKFCRSRRLLTIDARARDLDPEIISFFDEILTASPPFVIDEVDGKSYFCLSKLRNLAIDYAIQRSIRWIVFCDADTVIFNHVFSPPRSLFGTALVYYQKDANEIIADTAKTIENATRSTFAPANSWFIAAIEVFKLIRFDERMYGYGCEDRDFDDRVRAAGFPYSSSDLIIIHTFHEHNVRAINWRLHDRNKALWKASIFLVNQGYNPGEIPHYSILKLNSPHGASSLIAIDADSTVFDMHDKTKGRFIVQNGAFRIKWLDGREISYLLGSDILEIIK